MGTLLGMKIGRPRLQTTKESVKLSLNPKLRAAADDLAFNRNTSLSGLIGELLEREVAACAHELPPDAPHPDTAKVAALVADVARDAAHENEAAKSRRRAKT